MAQEAGCRHFTLVSTTAADKNSWFFMLKTKVRCIIIIFSFDLAYSKPMFIQGLTEEQVNEIPFERTTILRPGYLNS